MAKITASGIPEKYPEFGKLKVEIIGEYVDIDNISVLAEKNGELVEAPEITALLNEDMAKGAHYPLCAEPNTMLCALFILYEWYGEDAKCWIQEPTHVKLEGEIELMPSDPGVIY